MKRLIFVSCLLLIVFSTSFAQDIRQSKILSYTEDAKTFYPQKSGLGKYLVLTNVEKGDAFYKVAEKLKKFRNAEAILKFNPEKLSEVADKIKKQNVEYVCFVVTPEIIDINFVYDVLKLARTLDSDPFTDFLYGFITGENAEAAMKFLENTIKAESEKDKMPKKITHFGPSTFNSIQKNKDLWIEGYESSTMYHKRDELTDEKLKNLQNCRVIANWGHGMPEGIVDSLQAKDVSKLNLYPAVHFSGACYTGVALKSFDPTLRIRTVKSRTIKPEESFCLQILKSGVTAYLAAVDPDHGITAGQEFEYMFMTGCTLGEVMKHTYDDIVTASLKADYYPKNYVEGDERSYGDIEGVMLKGACARILYGDPKYRPVEMSNEKNLEIKSTKKDYGLEVEAAISNIQISYNFIDVFHSKIRGEGKSMNRKYRFSVEIPDKFGEVKDVVLLEIHRNGKPIEYDFESYMIENYGDRKLLHIQTDYSFKESLIKGMHAKWAVVNDLTKAQKVKKTEDTNEKPEQTKEPEKPDKTEPPVTPVKDSSSEVISPNTDLTKLSYLDAAKYAGSWLSYNAEKVKDTGAIRWAQYADSDIYSYNIYSGTAGIALYFLNMYYGTSDEKYLRYVESAANYLIDSAKQKDDGIYWVEGDETRTGVKYSQENAGFYNGASGIGWFFLKLSEFYKIRGDKYLNNKYLNLAKSCANYVIAQGKIIDKKEENKDCFSWKNSTDIIAGSAGIGLFFIEMCNSTLDKTYLKAAEYTGNWLIKNATVEEDRACWSSHLGWDRIYPNFSHGVSGIGYFFGRLFKVTKTDKYKEYMIKALNYMEHVAVKDENTIKWWHYTGEGEKVFQTGWCHGPAGTAYLYLFAYNFTKHKKYLEIAKKSAEFIMQTAQPWDNKGYFWGHSACCGTAAVGNFFIDLYNSTKEDKYLEYVKKVGDYLKGKAKIDKFGLKWTNYDRPDKDGKIYYGFSYRIGAAGIGNFFLRLHLLTNKLNKNIVILPDAVLE